MERILISACLIGDNTKYDGTNNNRPELRELLNFYELVPFCPEVEGGLKTPRRPSEIRGDRVRNDKGDDVTKYFNEGAEKALRLCDFLNIKIAILKERSPSCGTHEIHNGLFNGVMTKGMGITAKRLQMAGIRVMNEDEALDFLKETQENAEKALLAKQAAKERREAEEAEKAEGATAETKSREERPERKPRYKRDEDKPYARKSGERGNRDRKPPLGERRGNRSFDKRKDGDFKKGDRFGKPGGFRKKSDLRKKEGFDNEEGRSERQRNSKGGFKTFSKPHKNSSSPKGMDRKPRFSDYKKRGGEGDK